MKEYIYECSCGHSTNSYEGRENHFDLHRKANVEGYLREIRDSLKELEKEVK